MGALNQASFITFHSVSGCPFPAPILCRALKSIRLLQSLGGPPSKTASAGCALVPLPDTASQSPRNSGRNCSSGLSPSLLAPVVSRASFPAWQPQEAKTTQPVNSAHGIVKYVQSLVVEQGKVLAPKHRAVDWHQRTSSQWRMRPGVGIHFPWNPFFSVLAATVAMNSCLVSLALGGQTLLPMPLRDLAGVPQRNMELEGLHYNRWLLLSSWSPPGSP